VFIDDEQRRQVLRGIFESYYHEIQKTKTVFDSQRSWTSKLPLLNELYPDVKIICCVRNMEWIHDCTERLLQRNPLRPAGMFGFDNPPTLYARYETLQSGAGFIGFAYASFKEAFFSKYAKNMLVIKYETFTKDPDYTMREIYKFVDKPYYEHDFNNIKFDSTEFDNRMGVPGMHRVAEKVTHREQIETVLPPDIFNKLVTDNFWNNPDNNMYGAKII